MKMVEPTERFLATTTDFVVVHTTVEGVIEQWLGAAQRVLGFSALEAVGKSLSMFFTEDDRRRGLDRHEIAVALSYGRSEDDRWHIRKDGSAFWASGVLTAVKNDDGVVVGLCKVLRDKTDVRTHVQALENIVHGLKGELEAQRQVVRSLAHELRNPMTPIVAALSLLERKDAAHLAPRAISILRNQVDLLKRLVDDLNSVGIDSSASLSLKIEAVNLNALMSELVGSLMESARSQHRSLSLELPAVSICVAADPARLRQMLLNLLNNALKYTREGGCIDVNATVEDGMTVIRVSDDGVGISAEVLPKIFELFTREGRQPDVPGQGVGLAVVKELATAHGGFIEARSPGHDKGSTFSLRIPLHLRADKTNLQAPPSQ